MAPTTGVTDVNSRNAVRVETMAKRGPKVEPWFFGFEAEAGEIPEAIRYRRLLKFALRTLGLKCTGYVPPGELRELPADLDPEDGRSAPPD